MSAVIRVEIHESQSPRNIQRDLLDSLRTRRVNHKFHYDSVKQTNRWLALHQAYSPSRNDADCEATYDRAFRAAIECIRSKSIHVLGLGCGGGRKDTRLLRSLRARGKSASYTPSDVSVAMSLVANAEARKIIPQTKCFPLVCDLATADDLPKIFSTHSKPSVPRLVTFFGMIPNFEPQDILPKLAGLIRRKDLLLFSANLAPGNEYATGVAKILPQYDNDLTREWLLTFLLDLGVERSDGEIAFSVEASANGLRRVVALFQFRRAREILCEGESFRFKRGDKVRLFFSYRYTPERLRQQLARHGLNIREEWITQSGEEGVFLCQRG